MQTPEPEKRREVVGARLSTDQVAYLRGVQRDVPGATMTAVLSTLIDMVRLGPPAGPNGTE
jgi:hypothetical protein